MPIRVPLPPGAARWESPNDVAFRLEKPVRYIRELYARGLLAGIHLAGGYGGIWLAVSESGVVLDGPRVAAYREQRSKSARVGALLGAARSVAARKAKRAAQQSKKKRASR